ncbi:MAG TPA: GlsB/YeaQ/YmgE family stress response membrane protein [Patescibacteria group bacterium]|nr:GlsB/YeaQ/YmgE family stress response membrane protein [Patescibacteria group bacterium]
MNWIWFLLIGAIAGWLAGLLTRGRGFGLVGDIVIGIVGALVGGFVFSLIGLQSFGTLGALVTATVGAVILLAVLRMVFKRSPA